MGEPIVKRTRDCVCTMLMRVLRRKKLLYVYSMAIQGRECSISAMHGFQQMFYLRVPLSLWQRFQDEQILKSRGVHSVNPWFIEPEITMVLIICIRIYSITKNYYRTTFALKSKL